MSSRDLSTLAPGDSVVIRDPASGRRVEITRAGPDGIRLGPRGWPVAIDSCGLLAWLDGSPIAVPAHVSIETIRCALLGTRAPN